MIDVKEAAQSAVKYFTDLYGEERFRGFNIEETEISDDEKYWNITISYIETQDVDIYTFKPPRRYKTFKIDANDGTVKSMKIRNISK